MQWHRFPLSPFSVQISSSSSGQSRRRAVRLPRVRGRSWVGAAFVLVTGCSSTAAAVCSSAAATRLLLRRGRPAAPPSRRAGCFGERLLLRRGDRLLLRCGYACVRCQGFFGSILPIELTCRFLRGPAIFRVYRAKFSLAYFFDF